MNDRVANGPALLVGTRKGAWILGADEQRSQWSAQGPMFLGHIAQHMVLDPRDGRTLLLAASTGHLGPTVFRSTDLGHHSRHFRNLQKLGRSKNLLF